VRATSRRRRQFNQAAHLLSLPPSPGAGQQPNQAGTHEHHHRAGSGVITKARSSDRGTGPVGSSSGRSTPPAESP